MLNFRGEKTTSKNRKKSRGRPGGRDSPAARNQRKEKALSENKGSNSCV